MIRIIFATNNINKLSEAQSILKDLPYQFVGLNEFPDIPEIEETGKTLLENSLLKARTIQSITGLPTIADDTGLEVTYLNGAPGVKSARFSGEKCTDRELLDHKNMAKVLRLLEGVPKEKRTGRFVCCLCLARAEKVLIETQGILEGLITEAEKGENGFGYDPIFFVPGANKTVAQLTAEEKNAISHRGSAILRFRPLLDEVLVLKKGGD